METKFKNIDEELYDKILWILSRSCEEYQNKYDDDFRKLLDLLSRIKTSSFLAQCTGIIDMTMLKDDKVSVTTADLPKAYVEYVKLRDELGCWPFRKYVYKMRKMTDEEVAKSNESMEKQLAKMGLTRQRQMEISQKLTNASWKK